MAVRWYEQDGKLHAQGRLPGRPAEQPWGPVEIVSVDQTADAVQILYRKVETS